MRVCFYANVSRSELERIDFYANDLRILADLGYEVVIAETLTDVLRLRNIDIYYVWWWNRALIPIGLAKLMRAKVVVCGVFDYFLPFSTRFDYVSRPWWQRLMMRTALRAADANIFICRHEHDLVTRLLDVRQPYMAYLAVDTAIYRERASSPATKRVLNIAWSGAENARRKCLFEIIKAIPAVLEQHPDAIFEFGGRKGEAYDALRALAVELGVSSSVSFLGELTHQQKLDAFARAALYVQPSMYEGFGSAIAEAMACGVPVVTSVAGSLPEVAVGAEFVASNDPHDIAAAINRFFDLAPDARQQRGVQAAAHVRTQFSFDERRRKLQAYLSSAVSAPSV